MKTIKAASGEEAKVDDVDYELVSKYKWHVKREKSGCIYFRSSLPWVNGKRGGFISMHALLMGKINGMDIDHGDGDGANNQRYNLSHKTRSGNNRSARRKRKGASSAYRGVFWDKWIKRWRANLSCQIDGKYRTFYLGTHDTEIDAALAWNECALKHGYAPEGVNIIPV